MGTRTFLLLGSNIGSRPANLKSAREAIGLNTGAQLNDSSIYETAPWGKTDQPNFYNQAIEIETNLGPDRLLTELLEIEKNMGRMRRDVWGERIIDIDILFYGDEIIDTSRLRIPHPQLQYRRFALTPLNEIAPSLIHPALKRNIQQLLMDCTDPLSVKCVIKKNK